MSVTDQAINKYQPVHVKVVGSGVVQMSAKVRSDGALLVWQGLDFSNAGWRLASTCRLCAMSTLRLYCLAEA